MLPLFSEGGTYLTHAPSVSTTFSEGGPPHEYQSFFLRGEPPHEYQNLFLEGWTYLTHAPSELVGTIGGSPGGDQIRESLKPVRVGRYGLGKR